MSENKSTNLMDTAPGGENTQYESINTYNKPHAKEEGQFGDSTGTEASQNGQQEKFERGQQKAENIRYGEAMSEHGFGGETTANSGNAQQQGYGRTEEYDGAQKTTQTREAQGYGEGGSGVGALHGNAPSICRYLE